MQRHANLACLQSFYELGLSALASASIVKVLADMAVHDHDGFGRLAEMAKSALIQ